MNAVFRQSGPVKFARRFRWKLAGDECFSPRHLQRYASTMWQHSMIAFALISTLILIELSAANPPCPCDFIVHDTTSTSAPSALLGSSGDDSLEEYLNRYWTRYHPALSANHLQDLTAAHALVRRSFLDEKDRKRWKRPSWAPVGRRTNKRPSWAQVG